MFFLLASGLVSGLGARASAVLGTLSQGLQLAYLATSSRLPHPDLRALSKLFCGCTQDTKVRLRGRAGMSSPIPVSLQHHLR